ncbi:MAG: Na(+)/H(+) antiporter subunit B [Desulfotomaculales bacterium]
MEKNIIRKTVARILIPFIQLYGLYVIAHGEGGPGGGFQGGVILGASVILYVLAFGLDEATRRISQRTTDLLSCLGVLIYAGIGVLGLLFGGNYLDYDVLPLGTPEQASHLGIMGVEIGVGITVAAVMVLLFSETARRGEP